MRKDRVKIGMKVIAETTSGEPIVCTVLREENGEFVLSSQPHGYAIKRGYKEIQPVE